MQDIRVTVDGREIVVSRRRAGSEVIAEVRKQTRKPTLAEVLAVVDAAVAPGCRTIWWLVPNRIPERFGLRRCACGEVVVGDVACALCRALAPLLVSQDSESIADLAARHAAAERYLQRVAEVAQRLERLLMEQPVRGRDPRRGPGESQDHREDM